MFAQFPPERRESNWQNYVKAVPDCASSVGTQDTFTCLRQMNSSSLLQALTTAGIFPGSTFFVPTVDGPGGVMPDVPSRVLPKARIPVMAGSNLDEGIPQSTVLWGLSSDHIFS